MTKYILLQSKDNMKSFGVTDDLKLFEEFEGNFIYSTFDNPSFGWTLLLEYDLSQIKHTLKEAASEYDLEEKLIDEFPFSLLAKIAFLKAGLVGKNNAIKWFRELNTEITDPVLIEAMMQYSDNKANPQKSRQACRALIRPKQQGLKD